VTLPTYVSFSSIEIKQYKNIAELDKQPAMLKNLRELISMGIFFWARTMANRQWVVYLILCSDGSLYCGVTNNLKNRMTAHNSGRGAKYTRSRRPVKLVGVSSKMTKSDALKLEYHVKQVPAGKKIHELTKENDKPAPLQDR
jgi:putative endonuclease